MPLGDAGIIISFAPKGDDDVLDAIKKVTRHVDDLNKIAKTRIDLDMVKGSMLPEDFQRLKATVERAREATRDLGKEAAKTAKEAAKAAREADKMAASFAKGGRRGGAGPIGGVMDNSALTASSFSPAAVDGVQKKLKNLNGELDKTKTKAKAAGEGLGFVGRIIAAMAIRSFIHEIYGMANAFTAFENKIKTVLTNQADLAFVTKDLIAVAQRSRASLEGVATVYTRTSRAVVALGKSQFETMKFTETLSKAVAVGGSTTVEAQNAMIQLSQGMSSGTLKGDELRSVLEQLPIVAQLIADKMGVTVGALRKLGSEGKLTTDVVFGAIVGATGKIDAQFAKMKPTMEQIVGVIKDQFMVAIGQSSGLLDKLAQALNYVSKNFDVAFKAVEAFAGVIAVLGAGKVLSMISSIGLGWGGVAAAVGLATVAVVAFSDRVAASDDGVMKLSGASKAFWSAWVQDAKDAKSTLESFIELFTGLPVKLGFSWDQMLDRLAKLQDTLRLMLNPEMLAGALLGDKVALEYAHRSTTALKRARAEAIGEQKDANGVKYEETNTKFNAWMKGNMQAPGGAAGAAPVVKKGGGKESGKTFDQLIKEAAFDERNSLWDETEEKIRGRLHDMMAKLKPSIQAALEDVEGKVAGARKKFEMEYSKNFEAWQLDPAAEARARKSMESTISNIRSQNTEYKAQAEKLEMIVRQEETRAYYAKRKLEDEKEMEAFLDERIKQQKELEDLSKSRIEEGGDHQLNRAEGFKGIASTLGQSGANIGIQDQIRELEAFNKFAEHNKLADWAHLATKRIEELKASMRWENSHFMRFGEQMNSIFGPGGSLVTGFADAAANAIVMSSSLQDLKRSLVDVLNSVQKQALSSLIQLPLNIAMGALTNSAAGSASSSLTGEAGGIRSVGGAEASSWGLKNLDTGGYTGDKGIKEPAGIVHGQEFVLNAAATRRMGKQNLETINKGGTVSSTGAAPVQITVNNNAGVQIETNTLTPGQVEIMINKAMHDKTGKIVAGHINDPNSMVSKSISKNVDSSRRRV